MSRHRSLKQRRRPGSGRRYPEGSSPSMSPSPSPQPLHPGFPYITDDWDTSMATGQVTLATGETTRGFTFDTPDEHVISDVEQWTLDNPRPHRKDKVALVTCRGVARGGGPELVDMETPRRTALVYHTLVFTQLVCVLVSELWILAQRGVTAFTGVFHYTPLHRWVYILY